MNNKDNRVWWKEAIGYQIYVRSFYDSNNDGIGDLQGIIEKIPYLKKLGVDLIYLNPINKSPNDDNGYDISDFYDIMEEFGDLDTFKKLVNELHSNGMHLIMDLVLNHSSDEHPWFVEAKKDKNSKYHDFYIFREGRNGEVPNNWPSFFGGSAWEYNKATKEYYLHIFSKKQPDFNYESEELRKEIVKIIKFWKHIGVDGFRFDAINHISKDLTFSDAEVDENGNINFLPRIQNLPKCHDFIQELRREAFTNEENERMVLIGEAGGVNYLNADNYTAKERRELDMLFHFDFHSLGRGPKDHLRVPIDLVKSIKYPMLGWINRPVEKGWNPQFFSNHDTTRTVSRLGNDKEALLHEKSAKMLAMLQLTSKGTVFIYNGDEIGMTNAYDYTLEDYDDVAVKNMLFEMDNKSDFNKDIYLQGLKLVNRDNSRTPMQWNHEMGAGFTKSKPWIRINDNHKDINVSYQENNPNSIFSFYRKLIALRKNHLAFSYGSTKLLLEKDSRIHAYIRENDKENFLIILNFFEEEVILNEDYSEFKELLSKYEVILSNYDNFNKSSEKLRSYEAILLKKGL